jgi:hypothetical protein
MATANSSCSWSGGPDPASDPAGSAFVMAEPPGWMVPTVRHRMPRLLLLSSAANARGEQPRRANASQRSARLRCYAVGVQGAPHFSLMYFWTTASFTDMQRR